MTLPALDQNPVPTRTNRSVLLVLGLLFLAAGLGGLLLSLGAFGAAPRERPVLDPDLRSYVADNDWVWLAVAATALIVALLSLLWLRAQLSTNRLRSLDLERDRARGATTLSTGAVERACAAELQSRRGIDRARAVLLGSQSDPQLAIVVSLDGREPLRHVAGVVATEVLPQIRQALDQPELPVRIEYKLAGRPTRSLR